MLDLCCKQGGFLIGVGVIVAWREEMLRKNALE